MRNWAVYCMENRWPGLWRLWEEQQVASVGWPMSLGYSCDGTGKRKQEWTTVRNRLSEMKAGHRIVARLPNHRIGRVGEILRLHVTDDEWDPLVPDTANTGYGAGEQGRRIVVRWDFSIGPAQREYACTLPARSRLSSGKLRKTITELEAAEYEGLEAALRDRATWAPAFAHRFQRESALSDFIATHPERLEPGLTPRRYIRVREKGLGSAGRLDVLLEDAAGHPVVVECKQNAARAIDVKQLRRYMRAVKKELGLPRLPRGILVVGGAPAVSAEVRREACKSPAVEVFAHRLDVVFTHIL